jgi:hypothetical protein
MMRISVVIALHGRIRYVARNKRTGIDRAQFLPFEGLPSFSVIPSCRAWG